METSRGLGKWLVQCLMALPQMEGLRRLMLITGGAERMYEKYAGFRMAKQGVSPPYTPHSHCHRLCKPRRGAGQYIVGLFVVYSIDRRGRVLAYGEDKEYCGALRRYISGQGRWA